MSSFWHSNVVKILLVIKNNYLGKGPKKFSRGFQKKFLENRLQLHLIKAIHEYYSACELYEISLSTEYIWRRESERKQWGKNESTCRHGNCRSRDRYRAPPPASALCVLMWCVAPRHRGRDVFTSGSNRTLQTGCCCRGAIVGMMVGVAWIRWGQGCVNIEMSGSRGVLTSWP